MQKQNYNPNECFFQNEKISRQFYTNKESPSRSLVCQKHCKKLGTYFCHQCLSYNICQHCLDDHQDHSVHEYQNSEETKEATRQLLLLQVQKTLNTLKGRQNELKNQVEQVSMIRQKIKQQSNDLIYSLKQQIDELDKKLKQKIDNQFSKYEKELQIFYKEYDTVNNYLRQNLLQIIDGQINFETFKKQNISRDVNIKLMPNFGKIKQEMQKCKKYIKNVKAAIVQLQSSVKYFSVEEQKNQVKFDKYDKFLREKTAAQSDYNSPLLRTLNILEYNQTDLNMLRSKLKT